MQQRHIVSLLQEGYTTINVRFHNEDEAPQVNQPLVAPQQMQTAAPWHDDTTTRMKPAQDYLNRSAPPPPVYRAPRLYTYKAMLTDNIKPGDAVVVEVARGLVLVTVESVDDVPRIDVDATFDYKWVVCKVDQSAYQQRLQAEENFRHSLQMIERKKQQNRIKSELLQLHADDPEALGMFNLAVQGLTVAAGEPNANS